jgi:hypothetical protein
VSMAGRRWGHRSAEAARYVSACSGHAPLTQLLVLLIIVTMQLHLSLCPTGACSFYGARTHRQDGGQ